MKMGLHWSGMDWGGPQRALHVPVELVAVDRFLGEGELLPSVMHPNEL